MVFCVICCWSWPPRSTLYLYFYQFVFVSVLNSFCLVFFTVICWWSWPPKSSLYLYSYQFVFVSVQKFIFLVFFCVICWWSEVPLLAPKVISSIVACSGGTHLFPPIFHPVSNIQKCLSQTLLFPHNVSNIGKACVAIYPLILAQYWSPVQR